MSTGLMSFIQFTRAAQERLPAPKPRPDITVTEERNGVTLTFRDAGGRAPVKPVKYIDVKKLRALILSGEFSFEGHGIRFKSSSAKSFQDYLFQFYSGECLMDACVRAVETSNEQLAECITTWVKAKVSEVKIEALLDDVVRDSKCIIYDETLQKPLARYLNNIHDESDIIVDLRENGLLWTEESVAATTAALRQRLEELPQVQERAAQMAGAIYRANIYAGYKYAGSSHDGALSIVPEAGDLSEVEYIMP